MNYVISEDVLKYLLEYLSTRPYREVFRMISALSEAPKLNEETDEG